MQQTVFEAERSSRAFHNVVTSWGFQLNTGARCPGLVSNRSFASRALSEAAGLRMQVSLLKPKKLTVHIHPRTRHKVDNAVVTWGYLLLTGPRCGGVLSAKEYGSYEGAQAAATRMTTQLATLVE